MKRLFNLKKILMIFLFLITLFLKPTFGMELGVEEKKCPICHEDLKEQVSPCLDPRHVFCKDCIMPWIESCQARGIEISCPLCRRELCQNFLQKILPDLSNCSIEDFVKQINVIFNYDNYMGELRELMHVNFIGQNFVMQLEVQYISDLLELIESIETNFSGVEKIEFNQRIMPFKAKYQKLLGLLQIKLQQP